MKELREFNQYCSKEFKDYFYNYSFSKNKNTKNEYISYINILCGYLEKDFLNITPDDAQRFLNYMNSKRADGKLNKKTINVRLACYNGLAMYILDKRKNYYNPFSKLTRHVVKNELDLDNVPSYEELDAILTEAKKDPKDYAILALATRCALAASEILRLDTKSVIRDGDKNIQLHIKSSSDFENDTFILLPDDVRDIVNNYIDKYSIDLDKKSPLFLNQRKNPMSIQNVDQLVKKLTSKCNLEQYTLKDFRASAIADMINAGATMEEVSQYTGLKFQRLEMFYKNLSAIKNSDKRVCPPGLVNFRLVTE